MLVSILINIYGCKIDQQKFKGSHQFPLPNRILFNDGICSDFQLNLWTNFPINQNDWYSKIRFIWLNANICSIQISFSVCIQRKFIDIILSNGVNILESPSINKFKKRNDDCQLLITYWSHSVFVCPVLFHCHCHRKCGRRLCNVQMAGKRRPFVLCDFETRIYELLAV